MKQLTWQSQFWCPGAVEQENLLGGPERPFLSTPERSNLSVDPLRHVSPNRASARLGQASLNDLGSPPTYLGEKAFSRSISSSVLYPGNS